MRADVHRCNCCGQSGVCNLCTCPASVSISYNFEFGFDILFPAPDGSYPSLPNNEVFSSDWSLEWSGSTTLYRGCTCGESCSTSPPDVLGGLSAPTGCCAQVPTGGTCGTTLRRNCWRCSRYGCSGRTGCVSDGAAGGTETDAVDMGYHQASVTVSGDFRPHVSTGQQFTDFYEFPELEDATIWGGCSKTLFSADDRLYLAFSIASARCVPDIKATGCARGREEISGSGCKFTGESGLAAGDVLCASAEVVFQSGSITPGGSDGCLEDVTWSVQEARISNLGGTGRPCTALGAAPLRTTGSRPGRLPGVTLDWSLSVT